MEMNSSWIISAIVVLICRMGYKTKVENKKLFPLSIMDYLTIIIVIIAIGFFIS